MIEEPTTVGISEDGAGLMKMLVDSGQFDQMLDVYRLLIAYAIQKNADPKDFSKRGTLFNIGTLDPDRQVYYSVRLSDSYEDGTSVYKHAERLADWGAKNIGHLIQDQSLDIPALFAELPRDES